MAAGWTVNEKEGTALGPVKSHETPDGDFVTVMALWSDEDGVAVTIEGLDGLELLPANLAAAIAADIAELAQLPAPEVVAP